MFNPAFVEQDNGMSIVFIQRYISVNITISLYTIDEHTHRLVNLRQVQIFTDDITTIIFFVAQIIQDYIIFLNNL